MFQCLGFHISPDVPMMTYMLICATAFVQGMNGLADLAISYYFKEDLKLSPAEFSYLMGLIKLPWFIKPLWGYISDSYPIFGFRRKPYLIVISLIQSGLWLIMSGPYKLNVTTTVVVLSLIEVCVAFCNVIGEALLVEISRKFSAREDVTEEDKQAEASKNISLFFGVRSVGFLITAYSSGALLEVLSKKSIFAITAIFPLAISATAIFLSEDRIEYDASESRTQCCSIPPNVRRVFTFISQKMILYPILFVFFYAMTPSTSGAMFYFYTTELKFSPNFLGQLRLVYAVASLIGILIFNKYLRDVKFTKIFFWSTIFTVLTGLSQLILITRRNVDYGIPDRVFALFDSVIITVIAEINVMPILVLACRLCPKNIEGTMYALILSVSNFGGMLGMQWGGLLTTEFGVTETNFSRLWSLVLTSYLITLTPLLVLPFINFDVAQEKAEKHYFSSLLSSEDFDEFEEKNKSDLDKSVLNQNIQMQDNILENIRETQFASQ